jgi:hypothetical protein
MGVTKDSDSPLWLPPISLVVLGVSVWLLSFPPKVLLPDSILPFALTGQAFLLIFVIRAFCYWPPMVRWVGSMPFVHRAMFFVLIGSMIVGHFTLRNRTFYPYVSWFIFPGVHEIDPVTCREFIAATASGKKVRLLVEQLYPSIVQVYPLDDASHYPPDRLELLARAMARSYSARHADDPVKRVDLVVMSVQLHPPAGESRAQPSCQLLKRYEISSGQ